MSSIMNARSPHESSFSFSKRHFQWIIGKLGGGEEKRCADEEEDDEEEILTFSSFGSSRYDYDEVEAVKAEEAEKKKKKKKKKKAPSSSSAVSRIRAAVSSALGVRHRKLGLGHRVTGTLYGRRGGHMHFAVQADPGARPAALIELATSTGALVREMASGLVRIALECERPRPEPGAPKRRQLVEEPLWRAYCNGRKCGHAVRRECGASDWRVLRAVERVTMGGGVLPAGDDGGGGGGGEVMYMRSRFERVVGSKDSEAYYMMNPDNNGGPELTIYLLRA